MCTTWWWQLGCKDAWTPEFTDKFGWSVKIKSIQEELFVCTCVGSFINWENPLEDVSEYKFVLSKVLMSSDHQEEDLALKSPVIIDTVGLPVLISLKSCSKFNKNEWNSRAVNYRALSSFYYYHSFLIEDFLGLGLVQYLHGTAKEQINITTWTRICRHFQNNDIKGVNFQLKK